VQARRQLIDSVMDGCSTSTSILICHILFHTKHSNDSLQKTVVQFLSKAEGMVTKHLALVIHVKAEGKFHPITCLCRHRGDVQI
jgi:hypothetical protein